MISKACLVGIYQRKLEEIAKFPHINLTVLVPSTWKDARGELVLEREFTEGYELIDVPLRFNGNFHLHHYPGLRGIVNRINPHILHIDEEPYNLTTYLALHEGLRIGAKSLFFSWQNIYRQYPPPFRQLEKWVLNQIDYAIVGNQESQAVWEGKGYTGPMSIIPQFGVDPNLFSPTNITRPDRPFTIGYAGRLVEEKGLDLLIKAALGLSTDWQIRFLGEGPHRDHLNTLAGILNIGGQVHFEKGRPSTEMPAFYHGIDALVLPSLTKPNWKEQFGRVLIEAMACGVPVIGSDSGAIPEVIGPAGVIVSEGDEDALRNALRGLIHDHTLYQSLQKSGRKRVLNNYTQEQIAQSTVNVYETMINAD